MKNPRTGNKVVICRFCHDVDGAEKTNSKWTCDACKKDLRELRKAMRLLKVPQEIKDTLVQIGMEIRLAYRESFKALQDEIVMWKRLWCDQPEDRLYHAKDRTWWKRIHDPVLAKRAYSYHQEYSPYRASPPEEIMALVRAARTVKRKDQKLKNALSGFERYE